MIVKVALVLPLDTVTVAGTPAAAVLLLNRDTTAPPVGAGPLKVTVPVEPVPPATEDGFTVTEERPGRMSNRRPFETPPPGAGL